MAFDPNLPATHSEIVSAELRDQFNGLKALIDAVPAGPPGADGADGADGTPGEVTVADLMADLMAALVAERQNHAKNPTGVPALSLTVSNPPTQAEIQAIVAWNNALLTELQRQP